MPKEVSPYMESGAAERFNEMVSKDVAKQVIYEEGVERLRQLRETLDRPLTIADIGCGSGHFVRRLRDSLLDDRIIYADYSPAQLAIAAKKIVNDQNSLGVRIDLDSNIPLGDKSVDCITSHFVLSEIPDLDHVLKEFHRILKPNGICVISMTSPLSDLLTTTLRPGKLEGVTIDASDSKQNGRYTLGTDLTVPHYYRSYDSVLKSLHKNGFRLTDDGMVRFYPAKDDTIVPLPEYLLLYARNDRADLFHYLEKRAAYYGSIPKRNPSIVSEEVYSRDPRKRFFRVHSKQGK